MQIMYTPQCSESNLFYSKSASSVKKFNQNHETGSGYRLPSTGTVQGTNTNPTLNLLYFTFTKSLQRLLNLSNFSDFDRKIPVYVR